MLQYFVLLPCLLLAVEGAGYYDISDACHHLEDCQEKITAIDFLNSNPFAYAAADINSVCGQQADLTACIEEYKSGCSDDSIQNEVQEFTDVVAYICSDAGKQVLANAASSVCVTDSSLGSQYDSILDKCESQFNTDIANFASTASSVQPSDFCPFVDAEVACVGTETSNLCGADMGTFVQYVFGVEEASAEYRDFGCSKK